MLINVWALIWPNQRESVGIVPATRGKEQGAGGVASLASRTNTMFSIPMLTSWRGRPHRSYFGIERVP